MKNATSILVVLIIIGISLFFGFPLIQAHFLNKRIIEDSYYTLPIETQREIAHEILSNRWGNHDAALFSLIECGSKESIPYLLEHLKKLGKTNNLVTPPRTYIIEALNRITGDSLGFNYEDWKHLVNK